MKRGYETNKISPLSETDQTPDTIIILGGLSKEFSMSGFRLDILSPRSNTKNQFVYRNHIRSYFYPKSWNCCLESCKKDLISNRETLLDRADTFIEDQSIELH